VKRAFLGIVLICMAPQINAQSEQHDVNQAEEAEEFKSADSQSEQHDVNQAAEVEEFKPADLE
jgi:hypothetical protein